MKTKEDLKLSAVSEDEWRLIRLFRCMDRDAQGETLIQAAHALMRKYSVDPHLGKFKPAEETSRDELDPETVGNSMIAFFAHAQGIGREEKLLIWIMLVIPAPFWRKNLRKEPAIIS